MTWSVPSTKAICIVPSGTSSRARRSIRRTPRSASGGGAARPGVPVRARRPLLLEELTEPLLGCLERDPRDDRLEEAEDDELAGLVRRVSSGPEVEELSRIDRPHP